MNSKTVNICCTGKNIHYKRPTSPIHLYILLWMKHGLLNWFILRSAFWGLLVLWKILYIQFLTLKTSSLPLPLTDDHRREPNKDLMTFRTEWEPAKLLFFKLHGCLRHLHTYIHEVNKEMSIKYWLEDLKERHHT